MRLAGGGGVPPGLLSLAWVGWRWLGSNATGSRVLALVIWFGK